MYFACGRDGPAVRNNENYKGARLPLLAPLPTKLQVPFQPAVQTPESKLIYAIQPNAKTGYPQQFDMAVSSQFPCDHPASAGGWVTDLQMPPLLRGT